MIHKTALLFNFLLFFSVMAQGQSGHLNDYSLDLHTGMSVLENNFTRAWSQTPALHLGARIGFYSGKLDGGIRYSRFNATSQIQSGSDFHSFFVYLGWAFDHQLNERWHIAPGFRFGNNFMLFDEAKSYTEPWPYSFDPKESEFSYELYVRSEYILENSLWSLHATFSYNRTLTFHPLTTGLVTIGISRYLESPAWIKKIFK